MEANSQECLPQLWDCRYQIANEDTRHITRCKDTSRTALFMEGIEEIRSWLVTNHTPLFCEGGVEVYTK